MGKVYKALRKRKAEGGLTNEETDEEKEQRARTLAFTENESRIHSEAVRAYNEFKETDQYKANPSRYSQGPTVRRIKLNIRMREKADRDKKSHGGRVLTALKRRA